MGPELPRELLHLARPRGGPHERLPVGPSKLDDPAQLRRNVTSPNGTTQAGLEVLMNEDSGLTPLIKATVAAAADRSRELANG